MKKVQSAPSENNIYFCTRAKRVKIHHPGAPVNVTFYFDFPVLPYKHKMKVYIKICKLWPRAMPPLRPEAPDCCEVR